LEYPLVFMQKLYRMQELWSIRQLSEC